jgi:SAM-dependent methyltransferase
LYDTTAFLYDAAAAFEDPAHTSRDIHDRLLQHGLQPPGLLGDLGSGTGLMSILLAERGWRIHGIERSAAMLAVAREKTERLAPELQTRLAWTQGDITAFDPPSGPPWDGAISLCNTLNHLTEHAQVEDFLRCVFHALKPNGVLMLDTDTRNTFQCFFHHPPVVVYDDGTHRMTRRCDFEPDTGRAHHVALLERHGPQGLTRISEEAMALQYHREPDLFTAFQRAGFQLLGAEPYNPNPTLYNVDFVPKLLWTLRKPGTLRKPPADSSR